MNDNNISDDQKVYHKKIRSFVLRSGRMTESQQREYNALKDSWCLAYNKSHINFSDLYNNTNEVIVEIGFGMGHATIEIAKNNPDKNYLGIEVHKSGVGRVLREIKENNLHNLYIIEHDAVEVLHSMIGEKSIQGFHIFFPDPWPKKKHHKRRLVQKDFIEVLSEKLSSNGYIYMATDWEPYAEFALEEFSKVSSMQNEYNGFSPKVTWRPITNFERKGTKANRNIFELYVTKK